MNIVFMGTPDFAVPTLEAILKEGHNVLAVVTQPDKPKGRGKAVLFPPVKDVALKYNLPVYQPIKVKDEDFINVLRQFEIDAIVVVAYGQILSEEILNMPKYGCINVHASLLPKYRGAAPIQWAIIDGEEKSGVTTMFMEKGLDTGDMLEKEEIILDKKETGSSLHDKLSVIGANLLISTLKKLEEGTAVRTKQDDSKSCYAKMLTKELGKIDWSSDAVKIERLMRGLDCVYTTLNNKKVKIWSANVLEGESNIDFGTILDVKKDSIIVNTGKNLLEILELQLEGKKRMTVRAFLAGYKLDKGDKFI